MNDFLEQVVAERRAYVAEAKARHPLRSVSPSPNDAFAGALRPSGRIAVIAEVKRTSPSLGRLARDDFDIVAQARRYAEAGAAAISVLTEPTHWGGSLDDLASIRAALGPRMALLCKDVIVDEYQIDAAAVAGASAVLLIAEALTDDEVVRLTERARSLRLGVILEAHERDAFARAVRLGGIVGVNARDLRHPSVIDIGRIAELGPLVQPRQVFVAESGITSADDVRRLPARVDAVLIGTALMRAADPGALIREIGSIERVPA